MLQAAIGDRLAFDPFAVTVDDPEERTARPGESFSDADFLGRAFRHRRHGGGTACRTPVIGLSRGAVPEVVEHGVTGFVGADL